MHFRQYIQMRLVVSSCDVLQRVYSIKWDSVEGIDRLLHTFLPQIIFITNASYMETSLRERDFNFILIQ